MFLVIIDEKRKGNRMHITRRQFFKLGAAGLGSSSLALLGFSPAEALAEVR